MSGMSHDEEKAESIAAWQALPEGREFEPPNSLHSAITALVAQRDQAWAENRSRSATRYSVSSQWAEARQLLNDAGMSALTLPAAVAVLLDGRRRVSLTPPADEDALAAAVARHPAGRHRRPSLTVVPEVTS